MFELQVPLGGTSTQGTKQLMPGTSTPRNFTQSGFSALHTCIRFAEEPLSPFLSCIAILAHHVDVNAQDARGWSALHWAAYRNLPALVKALIDACDLGGSSSTNPTSTPPPSTSSSREQRAAARMKMPLDFLLLSTVTVSTRVKVEEVGRLSAEDLLANERRRVAAGGVPGQIALVLTNDPPVPAPRKGGTFEDAQHAMQKLVAERKQRSPSFGSLGEADVPPTLTLSQPGSVRDGPLVGSPGASTRDYSSVSREASITAPGSWFGSFLGGGSGGEGKSVSTPSQSQLGKGSDAGGDEFRTSIDPSRASFSLAPDFKDSGGGGPSRTTSLPFNDGGTNAIERPFAFAGGDSAGFAPSTSGEVSNKPLVTRAVEFPAVKFRVRQAVIAIRPPPRPPTDPPPTPLHHRLTLSQMS
jgi:hypothetical protein